MMLFFISPYLYYMEKKKISGIYKITNVINKKVYIGSAISIKKRWKQHKRLLKNNKHYNTHLQSAYNKYGEVNFIYDIIETVEIDFLLEREEFWIFELKANDNKFGYNKRIKPHSNLGIKLSKKTRFKLSISHLGNKHSDESKKKIGESNFKNINQFNKDGTFVRNFNSLQEAADSLNKNYTSTITACAYGRIPSAFGYIWSFNNKVKKYERKKHKK